MTFTPTPTLGFLLVRLTGAVAVVLALVVGLRWLFGGYR